MVPYIPFPSFVPPLSCPWWLRRPWGLFLCLVLSLLAPPNLVDASTVGRLHIVNVRVSHDSFQAHSEPAIAENPRNPANLVAGSKFFSDPAHYRFKIGTYYSLDAGRTWHDNGLLPGFKQYQTVSDVSFAFSSDGVVYACVLALLNTKTAYRSGIFVSRSPDGGRTWSKPVTVFLDTTGATFSDKPWIAVDQTRGPYAGDIYVAWNLDSNRSNEGDDVRFQAMEQRTHATAPIPAGIVVSHSIDGGRTFTSPVVVGAFTRERSFIGAIPQVGPDGQVFVVFASNVDTVNQVNEMDIVSSNDGGETFSPVRAMASNVKGLPYHLSTGTFRNLSLPTFAVSPVDGSMLVAWADMRNGDADILAIRSRDGGGTWSRPVRVNHDHLGNGKDQFQPALAVAADGTFTCAWFDRRHDPKNWLVDEEIAQSHNHGKSFGHNIRVTRHSWDPTIDAPLPDGKRTNTFIGDYQALAVDTTAVHPLWNDTQNQRSQEIRTTAIATQVFAQ